MVTHAQAANAPKQTDAALALIAEALDRLRFGDIRLTVHEGRLVQIDVTERTRLTGN
jgi:hypothetical protein